MIVDLDELERLARAATPGPWATNLVRRCDVVEATKEEPAIVVAKYIEDAAFIAAANPAAVLLLVARLRVAESVGERCRVCGLALPGKMPDGWTGTHDRCHRIDAIVRDLAAAKPTVQSVGNNAGDCPLCHGVKWEHTDSCPWRRAVEATKP